MKFCVIIVLVVSLALANSHGNNDHDHDHDDDSDIHYVTCGSVIKLRHNSGFRLHSHKVTYGSGSSQQSVTGFEGGEDANSFWVVKGPHGSPCLQGKIVKNGDAMRLQHLSTKKNLHSHLHKSPLTKQNEVSCYLEGDEGDTGDHWKLETKTGSSEWLRGEVVLFQHVDTSAWLHANPNSKFQHPIPGQMEITGFTNKNDVNNEWKTDEGIYFPERVEKKDDKEL